MGVLEYTEGIQRRDCDDISIENNDIPITPDCFFKRILYASSREIVVDIAQGYIL